MKYLTTVPFWNQNNNSCDMEQLDFKIFDIPIIFFFMMQFKQKVKLGLYIYDTFYYFLIGFLLKNILFIGPDLYLLLNSMAGQWFSPGTLVSSTNKIDHYDITEILLKVALNTFINNNVRHKGKYLRY